MKIVSWNVNGLRSAEKKGFSEFVRKERPDVLCIQEVRAPAGFKYELKDYRLYWNHAKKPGYAGTAIFSLTEPLQVHAGIGIEKHDEEGRVLTAEYPEFFVVSVYVPNSQRTLDRLPYRTKEWDVDFLKFLKKLEARKPVVYCGDFNVAHTEIDLANPKGNARSHGFTVEERAGFDNMVKAGFIDTFRVFNKGPGHYTWWMQFHNCRARNIGWRIDYVMISPGLKPRLKEAFILKDVMGSDHCPVGVTLS